jgi:hypothetical protein
MKDLEPVNMEDERRGLSYDHPRILTIRKKIDALEDKGAPYDDPRIQKMEAEIRRLEGNPDKPTKDALGRWDGPEYLKPDGSVGGFVERGERGMWFGLLSGGRRSQPFTTEAAARRWVESGCGATLGELKRFNAKDRSALHRALDRALDAAGRQKGSDAKGDVKVVWTDRNYEKHETWFKNNPVGAPENALAKARVLVKMLEVDQDVRTVRIVQE